MSILICLIILILFIVFILGMVGLVIFIISSSKKNDGNNVSKVKYCIECGSIVGDNVNFCGNCGRKKIE